MVGVNRYTGDALDGYQHLQQSIIDLMTTRIGTRVMRRDYGSEIPDLIDRPQGLDIVLEVTLALGEALENWEPRFEIVRVAITSAGPDGVMTLYLRGNYYPRGHLGDFSIVETDRELQINI